MRGSRGPLSVLVLLALLLPLVGTTVARAAPDERHGSRSLSVSPTVFVPGQAVTFTGNAGRPGRLWLQSHGNRPGDVWRDVDGSSFRAGADGRYRYTHPAPSMFGVSFRVVGPGFVSRSVLLDTRPQEITLSLSGLDQQSAFHVYFPERPLIVLADTSPKARYALGETPPIPGRTVSLQQRDGVGWRTIAVGTTDDEGQVRFDLGTPTTDPLVLRARQERYTVGTNDIGWSASFPAYFVTRFPADVAGPLAPDNDPSGVPREESPLRPTASGRFGWGAPVYDFGWEYGEDLDSRPSRGTRRHGRWRETSDGTGRATPFNGGLVLASKLRHGGYGDRGTTTATLGGNARERGRWEFRVQGHAWERGYDPYRFLLELVPPGAPLTTCSPESVVVADVTMGERGLGFGVRSRRAGARWQRELRGVRLAEQPFNLAVEVGAGHVTWFRDGVVIGSVRDHRATLGRPLVPRLSLVGQQAEMSGAQVDSDWQRAFGLGPGRQVTSGPSLRKRGYSESC